MKTNRRNKYNRKDSNDCYIGEWKQWTDFNFKGTKEIYNLKEAKEEIKKHKIAEPNREFKIKKIYPEKFYRTYYK